MGTFTDLKGKTVNRLTVFEVDKARMSERKNDNRPTVVYWKCKCECGKTTTVASTRLITGKARACNSCIMSKIWEDFAERRRKHGDSEKPLFKRWSTMIARCYNKNNSQYHNYGARGITVCDRWRNGYINFKEDVGEPPSQAHSLDRINNDGNYQPDNVRWATKKEQAYNRRPNVWLEYMGKRMLMNDWTRELGLSHTCLHFRLKTRSFEEIMKKYHPDYIPLKAAS